LYGERPQDLEVADLRPEHGGSTARVGSWVI